MRVAIASLGRFHVLDLARELGGLGAETRFYSYVRRSRAKQFGLAPTFHRGLLPFVAPLIIWQNYGGAFLPNFQERTIAYALNAAVIARLEPCDFFICMSGIYLEAAHYARRRFGAQIWLERGSRHIISQRNILRDLCVPRIPSDFIVNRELAGYEMADRIVVPSGQVVDSFVSQDYTLASKLFRNPYGVDLGQFPLRADLPPSKPATVLFVGGWSRRKGVDVLTKAIHRLKGVRLLHVGSLVDEAFPFNDPQFEHVDPVPQWKLQDYYREAHVFALASREEGLALVQAQALASGLPVVCTSMTGGIDLGLSKSLRERVHVVEPNDVSGFADGLSRALKVARDSKGSESLSDEDRELLSWRAYGRRYFDELSKSHSKADASYM
ncbi:glycosyltransferase family 4 protein [Mesorhizobium sp. M1273]|uniref:glycosyltransferase family 4 protein n=1 Tax=Mesorhizobium sp. M1273 TaxID=2957075 RepID=UPI00333932B2